jgi:hypothetical protein
VSKPRKPQARSVERATHVCGECRHLRFEHGEDDGPCYGGRAGLKDGEGAYCMCSGFIRSDE